MKVEVFHRDVSVGVARFEMVVVGGLRSELKSRFVCLFVYLFVFFILKKLTSHFSIHEVALTFRFLEQGDEIAAAFLARRVRLAIQNFAYTLM